MHITLMNLMNIVNKKTELLFSYIYNCVRELSVTSCHLE